MYLEDQNDLQYNNRNGGSSFLNSYTSSFLLARIQISLEEVHYCVCSSSCTCARV
jgi:hypothetical protein